MEMIILCGDKTKIYGKVSRGTCSSWQYNKKFTRTNSVNDGKTEKKTQSSNGSEIRRKCNKFYQCWRICESDRKIRKKLLHELNVLNSKAAFIQKATGNGNAQETVVPLSEQMGLNVFVLTEETRRKRQRNWQATRNLQLLQSRHAVNNNIIITTEYALRPTTESFI